MMAEAPVAEFSTDTKELAERLVNLTVRQAQDLVDCLKEVHGIEPAGGGVAMIAGPVGGDGGAAAAVEKSTFDVELTSFGDKKIQVIKVVRAVTGLGLKEAKDLVEGAPKVVKENVDKAEAEKIKKEIEDSGGVATIK
jgi:large subunit ribosomal protein L7/L12